MNRRAAGMIVVALFALGGVTASEAATKSASITVLATATPGATATIYTASGTVHLPSVQSCPPGQSDATYCTTTVPSCAGLTVVVQVRNIVTGKLLSVKRVILTASCRYHITVKLRRGKRNTGAVSVTSHTVPRNGVKSERATSHSTVLPGAAPKRAVAPKFTG